MTITLPLLLCSYSRLPKPALLIDLKTTNPNFMSHYYLKTFFYMTRNENRQIMILLYFLKVIMIKSKER